ncbi:MAG: SMP-30/gluconolactonase/LRE family protein [Limisphaerales bacterium]
MKHLFISLIVSLASAALAADKPSGSSAILPPNAQLEELWDDGEFTEGVSVAPDGRIYFSDISRSADQPGQILRFDPKTKKTTVFSDRSFKSNGLMFDRNGTLIACCGSNGGNMSLCKVSEDGVVTPIVSKFKGKRLLSPNDLVITPAGLIYFTDPRYIGTEPEELEEMCVYLYNPENKKLTRVLRSKHIEKPNGVHISPDGKTLYVAETNNGSRHGPNPPYEPKLGRMTLNAFPLKPNGRPDASKKKVLANFGQETGTDGMTIDVKGNIYAAVRMNSKHGIIVYSPQGRELAYIPTETLPTNCSFGNGKESAMLYITAGTGLYRIQLKIDGYHPAVAKN